MSQEKWSIKESAIGVHEIFTSFIDAGFTREEALELIKVQILANASDK